MPSKFVSLLTLTCGLLAACNSEPATSTGGASQTSTSQTSTGPGGTSSGTATEEPGVTEGVSMSGEVTVTPETGTVGETGTSTGAPGTSTGTSTGADLCAGYQPPGCELDGCAEGEVCKVVEGMCVPTLCTCDPSTGTEACEQDCGGSSCAPACPDVLCELECEFGFEVDRNGCQICACVEGPPPAECGCKSDKECVKTSPGCCPCNAGGSEVAAHVNCVDQVMKCDKPPEDVFCPQVYLCTDVKPACVAGQCVLQ